MNPDFQRIAAQQRIVQGMNKVSHIQSPIVYAALGLVCGSFWALGTSTQVLTSEAWMMSKRISQISFNAFGQLWDAFHGQLPGVALAPFFFGWGVQLALIVAAIGVEIPPHPRWRYRLAVWSSTGLIVTNSCGDWAGSAEYGFWGQCGFTIVIFFLTFVMLIFTIMAFKRAFALAKAQEQKNQQQP